MKDQVSQAEGYKELALKFVKWYEKAMPDDRFVYYFGPHLHVSLSTGYVRKLVWDYACEGKVYIFQARDLLETNNFNFIAVKSKDRLSRLIPSKTASERKR